MKNNKILFTALGFRVLQQQKTEFVSMRKAQKWELRAKELEREDTEGHRRLQATQKTSGLYPESHVLSKCIS